MLDADMLVIKCQYQDSVQSVVKIAWISRVSGIIFEYDKVTVKSQDYWKWEKLG